MVFLDYGENRKGRSGVDLRKGAGVELLPIIQFLYKEGGVYSYISVVTA